MFSGGPCGKQSVSLRWQNRGLHLLPVMSCRAPRSSQPRRHAVNTLTLGWSRASSLEDFMETRRPSESGNKVWRVFTRSCRRTGPQDPWGSSSVPYTKYTPLRSPQSQSWGQRESIRFPNSQEPRRPQYSGRRQGESPPEKILLFSVTGIVWSHRGQDGLGSNSDTAM